MKEPFSYCLKVFLEASIAKKFKKKVFPLLFLLPSKKGTVGQLREKSIRAPSIRGKQRLLSHFGAEPQQAHFSYTSGYSDLFKMQI